MVLLMFKTGGCAKIPLLQEDLKRLLGEGSRHTTYDICCCNCDDSTGLLLSSHMGDTDVKRNWLLHL